MSDFWEGFWIGFRRGARWGVPMLLGALAMAIGWVADKDSARRELAAARDSLATARAVVWPDTQVIVFEGGAPHTGKWTTSDTLVVSEWMVAHDALWITPVGARFGGIHSVSPYRVSDVCGRVLWQWFPPSDTTADARRHAIQRALAECP